MSHSKSLVIDFGAIEGPVFTGRQRGESLRTKYKLEEMDALQAIVTVRIPDSTYSISSSFFLGLFGKSVVSAGNWNAFFGRHLFEANDMFKKIIEGYVTRALQEKQLFDPKK